MNHCIRRNLTSDPPLLPFLHFSSIIYLHPHHTKGANTPMRLALYALILSLAIRLAVPRLSHAKPVHQHN